MQPRQAGKWRRFRASSRPRDDQAQRSVVRDGHVSAAQTAAQGNVEAFDPPRSTRNAKSRTQVNEAEMRRASSSAGSKRKLKWIDDESLASTSQKRVLALDKEHTWDSTVRLVGGSPEVSSLSVGEER